MRSRNLPPLAVVVLLCVAARLFTLGTLALVDPSEGRYASIGQTMFLSQDWLTPRTFKDGALVPFLAKPPLHTWLTALSYTWLGVNEFASRVPSFLSAVGTLGCVFYVASTLFSLEVALLAMLILLSSVIFFFVSGICMTDPVLTFAVAAAGAAYVAFTRSVGRSRWCSGVLFFVALALGVLVKGPLAIALIGLALGLQCASQRSLLPVRGLPWVSGSIVFFLICSPWYLALERSSPGFLKYFFINENLLRFFAKDYGDKYGSSHAHLYGSIWLMLVGAFAPWSIFWLRPLNAERRQNLRNALRDPKISLCCFLGLAPAILFTFAKQTSIYYVMPGLPWLAIVTANAFLNQPQEKKTFFVDGTDFLAWSCVGGATLLLLLGVFAFHASHLALLFSLVFLLAHFALTKRKVWDSASAFSRAASAVVILYAVGTWALAVPISSAVSSREVVEYVEDNIKPPVSVSGFLKKIPQSAYFYARLEPDDKISFELVRNEEPVPEHIQYVMARNTEFPKRISNSIEDFSLLRTIGDWDVFSRK